jgi:hypothetical protein
MVVRIPYAQYKIIDIYSRKCGNRGHPLVFQKPDARRLKLRKQWVSMHLPGSVPCGMLHGAIIGRPQSVPSGRKHHLRHLPHNHKQQHLQVAGQAVGSERQWGRIFASGQRFSPAGSKLLLVAGDE